MNAKKEQGAPMLPVGGWERDSWEMPHAQTGKLRPREGGGLPGIVLVVLFKVQRKVERLDAGSTKSTSQPHSAWLSGLGQAVWCPCPGQIGSGDDHISQRGCKDSKKKLIS